MLIPLHFRSTLHGLSCSVCTRLRLNLIIKLCDRCRAVESKQQTTYVSIHRIHVHSFVRIRTIDTRRLTPECGRTTEYGKQKKSYEIE